MSSNVDDKPTLSRRLAAEFLGTLFLLCIVVGSGIMGERLSAGNMAIALLANSILTGFGLTVLILSFGKISGAHLNPIVTLIDYTQRSLGKKDTTLYILAQLTGAVLGVMLANLMFGEALIVISSKDRADSALLLSEFMATFGLIMTIKMVGKFQREYISFAVGAYIAAAYWFTSSTSFANPVVTIARTLTNTFAGIKPNGVLGFILAQSVAAIIAKVFFDWFLKDKAFNK